MKLMEGKKGVIFGVSNTHGIAYAIAKQLHDAGADIAFTYAGEAMEKRVRPIAEDMGAKIIMSCDVTKDDEVAAVFKEFTANWILLFTPLLLLLKKICKVDLLIHLVQVGI